MRAMKDSGIEWIGEIPEEWNIYRIKNFADQNVENCFIDGDWIESPFIENEGIRYLTTGNIGDGEFKYQGDGYISQSTFDELGCKFVYPGDLIFSRLNRPLGRSCILPTIRDKYIIAVDNVVLRTKENKKYICYVSQCEGYQNTVEDDAKGTTMKRISRSNFGRIKIPRPKLKEQEEIVKFLDYKCSKLDSIIAKEQEVIAKLQEYKLSLITEKVTKGLNPNVEMKDSGIEWIGAIPLSWQCRRLKYVISEHLIYGANESGDEFREELPRYIRITDLSSDNKLKEDGKLSLALDKAKPYMLKNHDILFARSGASVGKTFYYLEKYGSAAFAGYLIRARINEDISNSKYIYYFTLSYAYENWKNMISTQATIQNIGADKYSNLCITVPKLCEQERIASYLDTKCAAIDAAITKKQALIEKFTEYKKSLIYEVVTGKKEV